MTASIHGRADRMATLDSTGALLAIHHKGRGNYTVALWTRDGALVGEDGSLSLPWQDHDRSLRDAAGFLAAYARPEESGAFSDFWTPRLAAYADDLDILTGDLEEYPGGNYVN